MKKSKKCIEATIACAIACETCITDCIEAGNKECILICRDCADICSLVARFEARDSRFRKQLHDLCAAVCEACAIECSKHAHHHESCKVCAEACTTCAAICLEL